MMKMKKLISYSLISLVVLWLLLVMLLTTTTGLKLTIKLIQPLVATQVSIDQLSGSIINGIKVKTLYYHDHQQTLQINQASIRIKLLDLLEKKISISHFTASSINYQQLKPTKNNSGQHSDKDDSNKNNDSYSPPLAIKLKQANISNISIIYHGQHYHINKLLLLNTDINNNKMNVGKLHIQKQRWAIDLNGSSLLSAPFTMSWQGKMTGYLTDGDSVNATITLNGNAKQLVFNSQVSQPFKATWQGKLKQWLNPQGHILFDGNWQAVNIFFGHYNLQSDKGSIHIAGPLKNYQLTLDTDLASSIIAKSHCQLQAQGNLSRLVFKQIEITTLGGNLSGKGLLQWQTPVTAQLSISGKQIDPGKKWQQWQGKIDFNSQLSIQQYHGQQHKQWQISWSMNQLNGKLNKQKLGGQWQIDLLTNNEKNKLTTFTIKDGRLDIGNNAFSAQGSLNQTWQLRWDINAPEINRIYPTFSGNIDSSGTLSGKRYHPNGQVNINIKQLGIHSLNIKQLKANVAINQQQRKNINVNIEGKDIAFRRQKINSINITGTGQLSQQTWQATIKSSLLNLMTTAQGGLIKQRWQGKITALAINNPYKSTITLQSPTTISLNQQHINIAPFCLSNSKSKLCGQLQWQKQQQLIAKLSAQNINLSMINALLPSNLSIDAPVDSNININGDSKAVNGKMAISLPYVTLTRSGEENNQLTIKHLKLDATIDKKGLYGNATINDAIHLNSNFKLPEFNLKTMTDPKQKLSAALQLQIADLTPLTTLSCRIDKTSGGFTVKLQLKGSLDKLSLQGSLKINNATAMIVPLGIYLKNISAQATVNQQNKLSFKAKINDDKGSINFSGYSHWLPPFSTKMTINSNNFTIIDTPEYQAVVNSQLKLLYYHPNLTINGSADIINATVKPKDFSDSVSLPDNIEYTDQQQRPLQFTLHLNLGLKNINIIYQGLKASLSGKLNINHDPKTLMIANGELNTSKGGYQAYGRHLSLEKGMLSYTNSPIDNPNIDIRAVRYIHSSAALEAMVNQPTAVGIELTGTLKQSKASLFARPSNFSQADILSYLLFGHGASSLNPSDENKQKQLLLAASSAGLTRVPIKSKLGLSEFGIQSNQIINPGTKESEQNTSMVLGKQLTPRLSARYTIGLLQPINIIEVIYQLSKHFQLQTDSSSFDNGADVIYTIETD